MEGNAVSKKYKNERYIVIRITKNSNGVVNHVCDGIFKTKKDANDYILKRVCEMHEAGGTWYASYNGRLIKFEDGSECRIFWDVAKNFN